MPASLMSKINKTSKSTTIKPRLEHMNDSRFVTSSRLCRSRDRANPSWGFSLNQRQFLINHTVTELRI